MSKPTIVFAPGAWHTPDCYDAVRKELHARGWSTEAIAYPSVGADTPDTGLPQDAAALRNTLERLAEAGKEIVLGVHSYGGIVGQNAVAGLGYKERKAQGKKGGVIMFVYLAAFVLPKGTTIRQSYGGPMPSWIKFDESGFCRAQEPEVIFYHDLDPESQKEAIARLRHSAAKFITDEVTNEPWHTIPCLYFFCETDKALPLFVQQQMAQKLGPNSFSYSTVSSHSPFFSQVQDVVNGFEFAAKKGQEVEIHG